MATHRVANRYPRSGERIAPSALRDVLKGPIPKNLRNRLGAGLLLRDLDEDIWRRLSPDAVKQAAQAVVEHISNNPVLKAVLDRRIPKPSPGLRLDSLPLENRTRRCLIREGFDEQLDRLGTYTIGDILSLRSFGPRCLLDLLTALEAAQGNARGKKSRKAVSTKLSAELTAEAKKLSAIKESRSIGRDDPRIGRWMHAIPSDAPTVFEMAEQIIARGEDPPDTGNVLEQLRQMRLLIERMPQLTVEEEMIQIFASPSARNREIITGYYGWADGHMHTLNDIGIRFGITRERVRQICAKLTRKRIVPENILAPVIDNVLELLHNRVPIATAEFEAELVEKGLTNVGMTVEAIVAGSKLLNRPSDVKIVKVEDGKSHISHRSKKKAKIKAKPGKYGKSHADKGYMAVWPDQIETVPAISDLAKKEAYFHGLSTTARIQRITARRHKVDAALVRQVLNLIDGFCWLDEQTGWFTIRGIIKHGLPKSIEKVLAVADDVPIDLMRAALSRNRRLWKEPPPEKIILEYCRLMPGVRVQGDSIYCDKPRNWRKVLTGVEAKLVAVLKKHGPLMDRGAMEELCMAAGMNRFSFHAFVSWSPVIEQFGHSLYGLVGAKAEKGQIDKMIEERRANRISQKVLGDHGVDDDGKVWLKYRLSKAASTYAVITIPTGLKKLIRGRFQLKDSRGKDIGTLATKDGRAWGLGSYLRKCGAKFNDQVTLTIDLSDRAAFVALQKRKPKDAD